MTLYIVATLLLTTLSAIVLADAGPPTLAVWGLPLLPGLAWAALRAGGGPAGGGARPARSPSRWPTLRCTAACLRCSPRRAASPTPTGRF